MNDDLSRELTRLLDLPLRIGDKLIATRLVLAPMTYLGHVAFRHLLDELGGCGLMFSEMCSAGRVPTENRRQSSFFRWRDEEAGRLIVQIVGSNPGRMAAAARRIEAEGLFGVDINLGCAVKSVCRYDQGAGLLQTPENAVEIVRQVRRAIRCPLTVKFRTGWQDDPGPAVKLARQLEEAGADALIFHPRVAPDRRTRPPRWEYIGLVKGAVAVPVFGNGDVFEAPDCLKMLRMTGCDGVALGRIAVARPWVFAQWTQNREPSAGLERDIALRLADLLFLHFEPAAALRRFQRYAAYLASNFAFGNTLYNRLRKAADPESIKTELTAFFDSGPPRLGRPNMNFMT